MQFSKNWLRELVDIKVSTAELCEQLTLLGLEVDNYKNYQSDLTGEDSVIKLDITPNRGDCFSLLGIARELSAFYGSQLSYPNPIEVKQSIESPLDVKVCKSAPSYIGRFITKIDLNKKTPLLIKERINLSGFRSIDPIVDITNYVLLQLGQPLHAFDQDKLQGDLRVRFPKKGEKITLLDEQKIQLDDDSLLITDEKKPVALAGIMGGLETGVSPDTESIFLESAFFKPGAIRGQARKFNLQTDASIRFERGVDYQIQELAIKVASQLIKKITGGKFGPTQKFINKSDLPKPKIISTKPSKINKTLGSNISSSTIKKNLKSLGLKIITSKKGDEFKVQIPSWRFDLQIEADLIEEVARTVGYDNLPIKDLKPRLIRPFDSLFESLRVNLISLGYNEVITYSFIDQDDAGLTNKKNDFAFVTNPISTNMSVMRPSLFSGLINTFSYNYNRGVKDQKIFEIGSVFIKKNKNIISENILLSGLISGNRNNLNWSEPQIQRDFFDLKGDLESLSLGYSFSQIKLPFLHPGKAAAIIKGKKQIGYLGTINPTIQEKLDIKQNIHFFELSLEVNKEREPKKFKKYSVFPIARRDLSFILEKDISSKSIETLIIQNSGKDLKEIQIFDVYEGKKIPKGKKSLAFSLFWQAKKRTMTDKEIDRIVKKIANSLSRNLNAELRVQ